MSYLGRQTIEDRKTNLICKEVKKIFCRSFQHKSCIYLNMIINNFKIMSQTIINRYNARDSRSFLVDYIILVTTKWLFDCVKEILQYVLCSLYLAELFLP